VAAPASDRRSRIEALLREQLAAEHVEVVDESHLHAGHAGAAGGGGHFRAVVVSPRFEGRSLVERQRLVYGALAELLRAEIHALALRTLTPAQWRAGDGGARA
jgi:BolA protein